MVIRKDKFDIPSKLTGRALGTSSKGKDLYSFLRSFEQRAKDKEKDMHVYIAAF